MPGNIVPTAFAADPGDADKMILGSWVFQTAGFDLQATRTTDGGDNWSKVLDVLGYTSPYPVYDPNDSSKAWQALR